MGEPGSWMRHEVPAELSSLVGRGAEVARTRALLATERLVTLTGPAGVGKTRIAVRAVRELRGERGADVLWAGLARWPSSPAGALAAELRGGLAGREALLVLDGCEQLGDGAGELVGELLDRWPGIRILATSQRVLGVDGETLLPVGPLVPPPAPGDAAGPGDAAAPPALAEIARSAAVRLYTERARGADPRFALTEHNAGAVAALCRALDGVPGALELAAARARWIGPAEALRRLAEDPLEFLAGGAGRAGGADALRLYRLAPHGERLLWERLSVFAGSFDEAAAAEVCGFGALGPRDAARILRRLSPALLAEPGHAARYRLPLAVRAFAARRLARNPDGDADTAARRHHERCRVTAERAAWLWRVGAQLEARALALRELPELRRAMDPSGPGGPGGALEIAVCLWFLWSACGLVEEGGRLLERALAAHPAPRPARALWLAAWLAASFGRPEVSDPLLVEAWAAAVQEGEDAVLAYLAHVRGTVALWRDRPAEAADEYRDALELLPEQPGFGPGRQALEAALAMALAAIGPAALPAGAGEGPDLWARSWAGYAQALRRRREGRPELARTWLLRSLETQFALGDRLGQALSAELLAQMEAELGRYEPAARLLGAVAGHRPATACAPRAERVLRLRLTPEALRAAHAEGARTPLRALLREL
ncbi:ATP-binding protein [Streptomyces sp. NPDC001546]|uniref:ATP-binding protein n=1 Tax=Streptomyces sp. NPDC001546 TaxID=3364585 RepID=UPI0036CF09DB